MDGRYESPQIIAIGTYVVINGDYYVIIGSRTNQEECTNTEHNGYHGHFLTEYHILEVTDEGDDVGKPDKWVMEDMYDINVL